MSYPNRRGGGAPGANGADGKQIELQESSGYVQWRYAGETAWRNLMPLADISGADGRSVNLRVNDGWIQWQHDGDSAWQNLMSMDDMRGADGKDGADGTDGTDGPPNQLSVGSVTSSIPGTAPQVTITGESPSQVINFSLPQPRDGVNGSNASLQVGTVTSLPAGSTPTVQITGTAPTQTINFGIPLPINGTNGTNAQNNTIKIGTVSALPAGATPTASITGASPNQVLNLGIPLPLNGTNGANNTLNIGSVSSGPAAASITGSSPNQTLNLVLPPGSPGTNGTNGTNGVGITSQTITYQQSASGTTAPTGTWTTAIPAITKGTYLWTRIALTLTDGSSSTSYAVAYQGSDGANYSPQGPVSRTLAVASPMQHSDTTKPFKVTVNVRATQTLTIAGLSGDRLELRVGPTATAVAPGGAGGSSMAVWESGITGIALMVGAGIQDGGQMFADLQAGWYFQVNRLSGTSATIVNCFTQSMS